MATNDFVDAQGNMVSLTTDDTTGAWVSRVVEDTNDNGAWSSITENYSGGLLEYRLWKYDDGTGLLQGANGDFDFLTILGDGAARVDAFSFLTETALADVTSVTWTEAGATQRASIDGDNNFVITSTDADDISNFRQSTFIFEADTGHRLSKTSVMDDNSQIVRTFENDEMVRQVHTDIPGAIDQVIQEYVGGSLGSRYQINDDGSGFLQGVSSDDVLLVSAGVDTKIVGGDGADDFVFVDSGDTHRILDFDVSEDQLDLAAFGISDLGQLDSNATVTQADADLLIGFDEGSLTLVGVSFESLSDTNFL